MESLEKIANLLKSIRDKTITIKQNTEYLKMYNRKLELLLISLDAYSINEIGETAKVRKEVVNPNALIDQIFTNKATKAIAQQIYEILGSNSMNLEEIVKRIKLSKHKVIEILNKMVKEKALVKHFDKTFIYRIKEEE